MLTYLLVSLASSFLPNNADCRTQDRTPTDKEKRASFENTPIRNFEQRVVAVLEDTIQIPQHMCFLALFPRVKSLIFRKSLLNNYKYTWDAKK